MNQNQPVLMSGLLKFSERVFFSIGVFASPGMYFLCLNIFCWSAFLFCSFEPQKLQAHPQEIPSRTLPETSSEMPSETSSGMPLGGQNAGSVSNTGSWEPARPETSNTELPANNNSANVPLNSGSSSNSASVSPGNSVLSANSNATDPGMSSFQGTRYANSQKGLAALPNELEQFWMVYDITPYTSLYPNVPSPQNALLHWIMTDTGEDVWHGTPFAHLSVTREKMYVYHNEQVQRYVSTVLDRFMNPNVKNELFTIRIVLLKSPDWRTRGRSYLQPYPVKALGTQGWLIDKDKYSAFMTELSKRSDFIELNAANNVIANAETIGWAVAIPEKKFVRDVLLTPNVGSGFVLDTVSVEEGYRMEVAPLLSTNEQTIEILYSCDSTAVEKMFSFDLSVPTQSAPRQRLTVEVPQIAHREIEDKIPFPRDRILLIDAGMFPMKLPAGVQAPGGLLDQVQKSFSGTSCYYNLLIFIEGNGKALKSPQIQ